MSDADTVKKIDQEERSPETAHDAKGHPRGLWFFFWGEFAERSSYYGMRAILLRYMAEEMGFGDEVASVGMSYFVAACYLLPLVGGYVADNFFGKYWTIVGFSLPYIVGQLILGIESTPFLIAAMALLAMGSGVIKPNISTLMGMTYDQQRPGQEKLRSDAFAIFYGAINIGAAMSSFVMPALRTSYGYQIAFLFPAILMAVAFLIFAAGKPFYAKETRKVRKTEAERHEQWIVFRRIAGLFVVVTFFWTVFDQAESTWTLFARDHLDLQVLGHDVEPDQIQGLNPVLIIVLLPPITMLWHFLAKIGLHLRATDKMMIGFVLTIVTMGLMTAAGFLTAGGHKVSIMWEVGAYVLITCAEVCISVVGLELAFTAAPNSMKSFVTACWLVTVFFGNILNAQVTPLYSKSWMEPSWYFGGLTLLMIVVAVAFYFVARRFNEAVRAHHAVTETPAA